jgi:hypothetical protein
MLCMLTARLVLVGGRAKDAPPAFARSNSQGADSSNISHSSKEGALVSTSSMIVWVIAVDASSPG